MMAQYVFYFPFVVVVVFVVFFAFLFVYVYVYVFVFLFVSSFSTKAHIFFDLSNPAKVKFWDIRSKISLHAITVFRSTFHLSVYLSLPLPIVLHCLVLRCLVMCCLVLYCVLLSRSMILNSLVTLLFSIKAHEDKALCVCWLGESTAVSGLFPALSFLLFFMILWQINTTQRNTSPDIIRMNQISVLGGTDSKMRVLRTQN
jgi:hypothetical protein